ncbi:MAG: hypothetical protein WBM54_03190 [Woeseia sp.]
MNNRQVNNAPGCELERARSDNACCNLNRNNSDVLGMVGGSALRTNSEACLP